MKISKLHWLICYGLAVVFIDVNSDDVSYALVLC